MNDQWLDETVDIEYKEWLEKSHHIGQIIEVGERGVQEYIDDEGMFINSYETADGDYKSCGFRRPRYVNCWISNIAFPTTINELYAVLTSDSGRFNVEDISLEDPQLYWTAPQWAKKNDIVFFMHSKTANTKISRLCTLLESEKERYSPKDYERMAHGLQRAKELYKRYGGKIFGCALVTGHIQREDTDPLYHWGGRNYIDMERTTAFKNPLDISEFRDFITISRTGAITSIFDTQYDRLCRLLSEKNILPDYILNSKADPSSLGKVNAENWLELANRYNMPFRLEDQFRIFYVDRLLRSMTGSVYRECRCKKSGIPDSFVDNVIRIGRKYLPVEVKLKADLWSIKDQVHKYCHDDSIQLINQEKIAMPNDIWINNALVIDTEKVYMYTDDKNDFCEIFSLEKLERDKIPVLRETIIRTLKMQ